jgi:hypothetical protein
MLSNMVNTHFTPWGTPDRPCWHCHQFDRMVGSASRCFIGGQVRIEAMPARGCSSWEREPGADDEPGPPARAVPQRTDLLRPDGTT